MKQLLKVQLISVYLYTLNLNSHKIRILCGIVLWMIKWIFDVEADVSYSNLSFYK